jgi:hypothetical protein
MNFRLCKEDKLFLKPFNILINNELGVLKIDGRMHTTTTRVHKERVGVYSTFSSQVSVER